ncbi:hypothetical protein MCOR18_011696, partial [Pyricularia oryzae]
METTGQSSHGGAQHQQQQQIPPLLPPPRPLPLSSTIVAKEEPGSLDPPRKPIKKRIRKPRGRGLRTKTG